MSNFIFDTGYFDKTGRATIGTATPKIVNGDVAEALPILEADQAQADLLHWGPCHAAIGSAVIGGDAGNFEGNITASFMSLLAPAFADRAAFGIYAKGTGTITFNSNYPISVTNATGDYSWYWGSLTENLIGVTFSSVGVPKPLNVAVAKDTGLSVISVVVRYRISSEQIA
jgi:hypothetical protein